MLCYPGKEGLWSVYRSVDGDEYIGILKYDEKISLVDECSTNYQRWMYKLWLTEKVSLVCMMVVSDLTTGRYTVDLICGVILIVYLFNFGSDWRVFLLLWMWGPAEAYHAKNYF